MKKLFLLLTFFITSLSFGQYEIQLYSFDRYPHIRNDDFDWFLVSQAVDSLPWQGAATYTGEIKTLRKEYFKINTSQVRNLQDTVDTYGYLKIESDPSVYGWAKEENKPSYSWNEILSKPTFFSGSYLDLTNKPTIPTNTNQLTNGASFITATTADNLVNKTGDISQWTNNVGYLTSFTESDPSVSSYVKSLTSFAGIKTSTDLLYKDISYTPSGLEITNSLGYTPVNPNGTNSQYIAGDGTKAAFPSIPTIPSRVFTTPTFNSSTTATQLSTTRDSYVQYSYDATVTISLLTGQSVTAILEYADNSGMSTNLVTLDSQATTNSGVLGLTQTNTLKLSGYVPAGKYRRVRFVQTVGTPTLPTTIKSGQEVQL